MAVQPARYGVPQPSEPVVHDLPSLRYVGSEVAVRVAVRRADDGTWRGWLSFGPTDANSIPSTTEIFCAGTEADLWQAIRDLGEHQLRSLYRSLTE